MQKRLKSWIANNRRSALLRTGAKLADRFLNAYFNTGEYDFESNGEAFALRNFAKVSGSSPVIWDVGAHYGEYAEEVRRTIPDARVICFEIVPGVAEEFERKNFGDWCELQRMGLSDQSGSVDIVWNKNADTTNSITPLEGNEFFSAAESQIITCPVSTVDMQIAQGLPKPDFLKIDVEGHEPPVIRGASELLGSKDAPLMIQFEYGLTWLGGGGLLAGVHTQLEGHGYRVGRLFPDHVEFKSFHWSDEHFRMGNMVAVRDEALVRALS